MAEPAERSALPTTREQLARMTEVLERQDARLGEIVGRLDSIRLAALRAAERRGFFSRVFGRGTVP